MRRRFTPRHKAAAHLLQRSLQETLQDIEPLVLARASDVPIPLLSVGRLLVERVDCQLACLLDRGPITALDMKHVMLGARWRLLNQGLLHERARLRCAVLPEAFGARVP